MIYQRIYGCQKATGDSARCGRALGLVVERLKSNEFQAIEFNRHPSIPAHGDEIVPLVIRDCPGHDGVTLSDQGFDILPDAFPNAARVLTNVNAGADLQEPHCQSPS